MISSAPLKMGRGRPRKKNVAVATVASPMTPDVRNAQLVGADCQSCVMRISGREVESVGDTRTVRQFNIKWKDSPDWTWVNEEDFLKLINTMAAVVDVYTSDRPESKVQLEPVAGRRNFLAIAATEPELSTSTTSPEKMEWERSTFGVNLSVIESGSKRPHKAPDDDELSTSSEYTEPPQRKKVKNAGHCAKKQGSVGSEYVVKGGKRKKKTKLDEATTKTVLPEEKPDQSSPEINKSGPPSIVSPDLADSSSQSVTVSEVKQKFLADSVGPHTSSTTSTLGGSGNVPNVKVDLKIPKKLVFASYGQVLSIAGPGVSTLTTAPESLFLNEQSLSSLEMSLDEGKVTNGPKGRSSSRSYPHATPQLGSHSSVPIIDSKELKAGPSSSKQEVNVAAPVVNNKPKRSTEPLQSSVASLVKEHWKTMQKTTKSPTVSLSTQNEGADQQYEVERVIGAVRVRKSDYFLVHWKGYPDTENSWEIRSSMKSAKETIDSFQFEFGKLTCEKTCLFSPEGQIWDAAHSDLRP